VLARAGGLGGSGRAGRGGGADGSEELEGSVLELGFERCPAGPAVERGSGGDEGGGKGEEREDVGEHDEGQGWRRVGRKVEGVEDDRGGCREAEEELADDLREEANEKRRSCGRWTSEQSEASRERMDVIVYVVLFHFTRKE
jgi:hypothetical protein